MLSPVTHQVDSEFIANRVEERNVANKRGPLCSKKSSISFSGSLVWAMKTLQNLRLNMSSSER